MKLIPLALLSGAFALSACTKQPEVPPPAAPADLFGFVHTKYESPGKGVYYSARADRRGDASVESVTVLADWDPVLTLSCKDRRGLVTPKGVTLKGLDRALIEAEEICNAPAPGGMTL